jgi:hypothetical protein
MSKTTDKTDIGSIAADLGMHYMELSKVIERIKLGMFMMYYRHDATEEWQKEFNETIKVAYKKWTGTEFDANLAATMKVTPIALMGPPGHGKTTAFKVAAKWFAKQTGLTYIDRIDIRDYVARPGQEPAKKLDRNSFLFVSQEFSGEVSKAGIGLPFKSTGSMDIGGDMTSVEYMSNMMPGRFQLMKQAKAAVLLFDDFVNASPAIQNIALSITNENRFQDMDYSNVYIGVTGNLGAVDGTNTSKMSSALLSRLEAHVVSDHAADFSNRLIERTKDKIGDLGLSGFLRRNSQFFWKMPTKGAFPCPRTWDLAIDAMRVLVMKNGGSLERSLDDIQNTLPSFIGAEVATHTYGYLHQLTIGADPLARKMIREGSWDTADKEKLERGHKGGFSGDSLEFSFQLGSAMADYAAQEVVLHPKHKELEPLYKKVIAKENLTDKEKAELTAGREEILKETIRRFVIGMSHVAEEQALAFGIQQFSDKVSYQLPAWSQENTSGDHQQRTLVFEVKALITKATKAVTEENNPLVKKEKINVVIDALCNVGQFGGPPTAKKRKAATT